MCMKGFAYSSILYVLQKNAWIVEPTKNTNKCTMTDTQVWHAERLTRVILKKSIDGLLHRTSSSRLRFSRAFLSFNTHGWERHRSKPWRRLNSGVDVGVLLAEGKISPGSVMCSWDRERRLLGLKSQGPPEFQRMLEVVLPSLPSTKPLLAEEGLGTGDVLQAGTVNTLLLLRDGAFCGRQTLVLLCKVALPWLLQRCKVALPPLLHRLFETGVQTLELPGFQGDRQRDSSSGSDSDLQCLFVGGASGCPKLSLRLSSLIQPDNKDWLEDSFCHGRVKLAGVPVL